MVYLKKVDLAKGWSSIGEGLLPTGKICQTLCLIAVIRKGFLQIVFWALHHSMPWFGTVVRQDWNVSYFVKNIIVCQLFNQKKQFSTVMSLWTRWIQFSVNPMIVILCLWLDKYTKSPSLSKNERVSSVLAIHGKGSPATIVSCLYLCWWRVCYQRAYPV